MSDSLRISWHDSNWVPHLNPSNILDYFCQKSNPFYDRNCSNELAKMQRTSLEQMNTMIGIEYTLLHVQEPILYVIRKQHRNGPESTNPLVDYYILAGVVYQAPDLNSIVQSRVLNASLNLKGALDDFLEIKNFTPSSGFSWTSQKENTAGQSEAIQRPEESTRFQSKVSTLLKNFSEPNP